MALKDVYTKGTFIGNIEWPTAFDGNGKLCIQSVPAEIQSDLAALYDKQMQDIQHGCKRHDMELASVTHVVTISDECPESSVIQHGPYLVLESHPVFK